MKLFKMVEGIDVYKHYNSFYIDINQLPLVTDVVKSLLSEASEEDYKEEGKEEVIDIHSIRSKYIVNSKNKYLPMFKEFKQEIYANLVSNYNRGFINRGSLEKGFKSLESENVSLPNFLHNCGLNYHSMLLAFVFIITKGVISTPPKEAASAKRIASWLLDKKLELNEVQEAWEWMRAEKKYLSASLASLASVIADFKMKGGKSLETLIKEKLNG